MACLFRQSPQRNMLQLLRNQFNGSVFQHYYLCPYPSPFTHSFTHSTTIYRVPSICQVWTKGWQPSRCTIFISSSSWPWPVGRQEWQPWSDRQKADGQLTEGTGPTAGKWQSWENSPRPLVLILPLPCRSTHPSPPHPPPHTHTHSAQFNH